MAAVMELPGVLQKNGGSRTAAGVEVPAEYDGEIPEGYELSDLPECTMLMFQTEAFADENDFCRAVESACFRLVLENF